MLQIQENQLYTYLSPVFEAQGFELLSAEKQFRLSTRNGYRSVLIQLYGDPLQPSISLQLGIRLDVVEELVQQFLQEVILAGYQQSMTILGSYSRLVHHPYKRFMVKEEEDLEHICQRITTFMRSSGFKFLENFDQLRKIDGLLNRKPEQPTPFLQNQMIRCYKGLALAKLTHRTDFNQLAKTYCHYLQRHWADQSATDHFKRMVKYLRFFSIN